MSKVMQSAPARRRTRVLQVIGSMHIGGAERVVAHIARGLDRDRFEVAVCCTRSIGTVGQQVQEAGIEVRLAKPPHTLLRHFTSLALAREIAAFKPDVIHSHGASALVHTGPLGALRRSPWVHTFHFGNYPKPPGKQASAERFFARYPTRLIAVSHRQRVTISDAFGMPEDRIDVLVNGVAPNPHLADARQREEHRRALGFEPQDVVVGTVAVLSEQKGISYLLKAAGELLREDARIKVLIVGGGPLEQTLRAEAEAMNHGGRIIFTGWRQDALELLPCLDVFVMSSLWEAMPMVLLEAMAAARPIVVTDVGDNRRVVADGECAVVVPAKDAAALAEGVRLLISDRDSAGALGLRAANRFYSKYTVSRMVQEHADLYTALGERRGKNVA